jgi:hypothetical protein
MAYGGYHDHTLYPMEFFPNLAAFRELNIHNSTFNIV